MAERSKALVLGTSLLGGVGSNPTAAKYIFSYFSSYLLKDMTLDYLYTVLIFTAHNVRCKLCEMNRMIRLLLIKTLKER